MGKINLQLKCEVWNRRHEVGCAVEYHPIIGEAGHINTTTRSKAYVLSGHTAVLFVKGVSGCVALEAVIAKGELCTLL